MSHTALTSTEARQLRTLTALSADLGKVYSKARAEAGGDDSSESSLALADLLDSAEEYKANMNEALLTGSGIGKVIGKMAKGKGISGAVASRAKKLVSTWTSLIEEERKAKKEAARANASASNPGKAGVDDPQEPRSVSEYRKRLVSQSKEMYKDPPMPPVTAVEVYDEVAPPPSRAANGDFSFKGWPDFKPNVSPEEVLRGGAFGGTYFRTITSAVTNLTYTGSQAVADSLKKEWYEGMNMKSYLTNSTYSVGVNKFRAKCGGSLGMWESSGWISSLDPYGWFQWYCRFFQGRRCSDDERQIKRWAGLAGVKGRFRNQLLKKCILAGGGVDNPKVSPVVRQTLW
eukprot:CAMPEP_0197561356 /NCGR_PEP_ID=MMETSP1320-20131121/24991_1 /TAXON_ID=91990 /ORGANISM="Bolidomonas sp., Strain RCC2347" /LENGTH=344 /DNA_ID=CAMNT_0043122979 /DNA_START=31 /DNA_END=1062 /DNA_ORIENTATION=-